jgi:predicted nuclease of restriction endonuclease-like (RecB) superfamily
MELIELKAKYTQQDDVNQNDYQYAEIEAVDCGAGFYFVIKTERWAVDSEKDLIDLFNDFKKRLRDAKEV